MSDCTSIQIMMHKRIILFGGWLGGGGVLVAARISEIFLYKESGK